MGSDIEMTEAGDQTDKDDLKSSTESEPQDEYDVEEILAERPDQRSKKKGRMEYLVKWLGYDLFRSEWVPARDCLHETLAEWEKKKAKIKAKEIPPFNVGTFNQEVERREKARVARKEARQIKRNQRAKELKDNLFPPDDDQSGCTRDLEEGQSFDNNENLFCQNDSTDPSDSNNSDPAEVNSPTHGQPFTNTTQAVPSAAQVPGNPGQSSEARSSSSPVIIPVSIERIQPVASPGKSHQGTTQNPIDLSQASKNASSDSIGVNQTSEKSSQVTVQSSQNTTKATCPVKPKTSRETARRISTARPQHDLSGFGDSSIAPTRNSAHFTNTKWHGQGSRWGSDRAPDASELRLLKPSEFTSLKISQINMASSATKSSGEQANQSGDGAQEIERHSSSRPADSRNLSESRHMPDVPEGSNHPQSGLAEGFPKRIDEDKRSHVRKSAKRRLPDTYRPRSSLWAGTSSQYDSYRPSERSSRRLDSRSPLPSSSPIQHSTASSRYGKATDEVHLSEQEQISQMPVGTWSADKGSKKLPNGHFWNRGEIYAHVFYGPDKTSAGAVRICGIPTEIKEDLIRCKQGNCQLEMWFKDLCNIDQYATLCYASRSNDLIANCWMEGFDDTNPKIFYMAKYLWQQNKVAVFYPQGQRSNTLLAFSRASSDFKFLEWDTNGLSDKIPLLLCVRAPLRPLFFLAELEHTSSGKGPLDFGDSGPEIEDSTASVPNAQDTATMPPKQQPSGMPAAMSTNHDAEEAVKTLFATKLQIKLEDLARLSDSSRAENFFLFFPPEENEEYQLMRAWLLWSNMSVYSDQDKDGWSRFYSNSRRGVVIFHESFAELHAIRPEISRVLMGETFKFWIVRLSRKLELPDPYGLFTGDHCQQMFPEGGLILIAEDIFHDLRRTAILVYWFRYFSKSKDKTNRGWKLILPPNSWNRLKKRLQETQSGEDTNLLLSIISSIRKLKSVDDSYPCFEESSLSPAGIHHPNSNIVSLPIPGYGSRSEDDHPAIPKGLSPEDRKMDHLAEAFAGWALTKVARFRRLIILSSNESQALRNRWKSWGHIILYRPHDFFIKFKIHEEKIMGYLRGERLTQNGNSFAESTPVSPMTPANTSVDVVGSEAWKKPSEFHQLGAYK